MRDTFMFLELSNNIFPLFINNIFQSCKIILQYFCANVRVYFYLHACHTCIDTSIVIEDLIIELSCGR
jgi:hypothetical protein